MRQAGVGVVRQRVARSLGLGASYKAPAPGRGVQQCTAVPWRRPVRLTNKTDGKLGHVLAGVDGEADLGRGCGWRSGTGVTVTSTNNLEGTLPAGQPRALTWWGKKQETSARYATLRDIMSLAQLLACLTRA